MRLITTALLESSGGIAQLLSKVYAVPSALVVYLFYEHDNLQTNLEQIFGVNLLLVLLKILHFVHPDHRKCPQGWSNF